MNYNLNNYWFSKLETTEIFKEDLWVEFAVVTLSRIVYTLKENEIKSKIESCNYILKKHPEWKDIIKEGLAIRNLNPNSIIEDVNIRKEKTINFISTMVKYGNNLIPDKILQM